MNFTNKRIIVMGLGIHGGGLGVARFLAHHGAQVTVTDLRKAELLAPSLQALEGLPIRYVLGEHREDDFRNADMVVRNPGVPASSPFLQIARAAGVAIEMEMSLFFRLCPGPIFGITGTKGKTTSTMLTAAMLTQRYADTVIAGNLRISALEALPRISARTPVVLELSSFALEGLGEAQLSPTYAAVTNISADHLDRYPSMQAYTNAKAHIWRYQREDALLLLPADDALLLHMAEHAPAQRCYFGATLPAMDRQAARVGWQGQELLYQHDMQKQVLCKLEDVRLRGSHNLANIALAAGLAHAGGVPAEQIRAAVQDFQGVPYRQEFVRELDGVQYVNDTAATAPEAAIAALKSFSQPIVLIAGGANKQLPFEGLAQAINTHASAVVLLDGTATPLLMQELQAGAGHKVPVYGPYLGLDSAVQQAREIARPGDVILLSPGCASFGMFRNEFHRGDEFRRIVESLS